MITALRISNFALIDHLDVAWNPGLTVMTGETGAGKSIFLGALQLVLGGRADLSVVQDPTRKCVVEMDIQVEELWRSWFEEQELDYFPLTTLRRELAPGGKSRAFINDTPVTLDVLSAWMARRVDVHSQRETAFLTDPEFLLDLIDGLGTPPERLTELAAHFDAWQSGKKRQKELLATLEGSSDTDYLRFQLDELHQAGVAEGAYEALNEAHGLLANASELKGGLHSLAERVEGDGGASELLLLAARDLESVGKSWPEAAEMGLRLRSAVDDIREVVREAERKLDGVEEDPNRLEILEEKLGVWHRLFSKHRLQTPQELVDLKSKLEAQWSHWEGAQESLDRLAAELEVLEKRYRASSSEVHALRVQVAHTLTEEVLKLLHALNLPHARWEVRLGETASDSKRGNTSVELWFSANPGTALSEVRKTASGGERSRLMLALKAVFARSKGLQTIFFDEIDTGISGQTASQVAAIFKQMAQSLQVVVITHLPQVAAAGESHWRIEKATEAGRTQTQLRPLEGEARVEEVARMLSGATVTPAALENARELIFVSLHP